jgi:uncharacterized protein (DUF1697 family)
VTAYAALLQGINLGKRRVAMKDLQQLMAEIGFEDVRPYLASGNAVFRSPARDRVAMADRISAALEERYGFAVPCLVVTHRYLDEVVRACPFATDGAEGRHLHAVFFSGPVPADRFAHLDAGAFRPEELRLGDRVMYLHTPGGLGRSALAAALTKASRRIDGVFATTRNWNTVTALRDLTR